MGGGVKRDFKRAQQAAPLHKNPHPFPLPLRGRGESKKTGFTSPITTFGDKPCAGMINPLSSPLLKKGDREDLSDWIPAFAGMTEIECGMLRGQSSPGALENAGVLRIALRPGLQRKKKARS